MKHIAGNPGRLSPAGSQLISAVKAGLDALADLSKASKMQAYMKSEMPYYGVMAAAQGEIYTDVFQRMPLGSFSEWRTTVLKLWRDASFREERYAAIELSGWQPYRSYMSLESLPVYEEMIVTGAWWDHVDTVAIHRIGDPMLITYPRQMKALLKNWSADGDLWRRRTSIIAQVALKKHTDLELLYHCIENNLDDKDFFIRKAIGWALRAYAWIDEGEITRYVSGLGSRISTLSRREALKNVGRTKKRAPTRARIR